MLAGVTWRSSRLVRTGTSMLALVIAASPGPALAIAGRTVLSFPWAPPTRSAAAGYAAAEQRSGVPSAR